MLKNSSSTNKLIYFPIISYPSSILINKNNTNKYGKLIRLIIFLIIFSIGIFGVIFLLQILTDKQNDNVKNNRRITLNLLDIPKIQIEEDSELVRARNQNCSYWDCFNVYKCGQALSGTGSDAESANGIETIDFTEHISIYVYPLQDFIDAATGHSAFTLTKEFYFILKTIIDSKYYTANPNEACIFIPSIDILNENLIKKNLIGKALATLPHWNNGENHLLFNIVAGAAPDYNTVVDLNTDRAMIAGAGFDTWTYRTGFDIAMPFYSPIIDGYKFDDLNGKRPYLLISSQLNLYGHHTRILQQIAYENTDVLLLQKCTTIKELSPSSSSSVVSPQSSRNEKNVSNKKNRNKNYNNHLYRRCSFPIGIELDYPDILSNGVFCLVGRGKRLAQPTLLESLAANCIPIIMADNIVLPFSEVIDWNLVSITIRETELHTIKNILKLISQDKIKELREQGKWLYNKYFKNIQQIVLTILDELNDRVFPHLAKNYLQWNLPMNSKTTQNPLFLPLIAPKSQGFTAVILTYDRVDSLFTLIQKLTAVPSLQKILVIWNNQKKSPPHPTLFPKISKPLKVIRTKSNKLSNRFYPYEEIETEAILTIDDDIIMLTADELDFGYEVWREFPDRIVGFPSRTHVWDNVTNRWRYESEWTNQISMVLTGAAFHHKYWSYMYTNAMPGDIKDWVDDHMNCEDIAMNFLVANITNKPPIKVAPRKKFKCPECTNTENLSADLNHMMERSACINRFAGIYGRMPLKTVEFRADPVLFKDNFPEKLKRFNDIGSL